jgi:hypothetical protein
MIKTVLGFKLIQGDENNQPGNLKGEYDLQKPKDLIVDLKII